MNIRQLIVSTLCLITISFTSTIFAQTTKLVSSTYIGQFTPELAKLSMAKMPPLNTLDAKYTLNLYKVTYHTSAPDGQPTFASGFVAMPIATDKKPAIISYFHGTRVNRNDVPSRNDEKNYIYPAVFGSHAGYMVVMPDYLGLGDNDLPIHPYVDSKTLASSSIDMLIAAKELAASLNYQVSNKLYLAGYSEGGYTTTVTYEELLKNHKELPVTAVSPGSAPYDYDETMRFVALEPGPRAAAYFAYFFYSLQTYHHYWSGLNEIFNQPYETLVPKLLDGYHQTAEIMQALPTDPRQLLKPAFFDAFIKGTEEHTAELRREFNHYDFSSTSPLLMVGTKGDHDVPYHGAEIAYEVFKSKSNQVYIKHVSDVLDHLQAFPLVMKAQLDFFEQYNQ